MLRVGEWFFAFRPVDSTRCFGWCARTPLLGNGPEEVDFGEDVFFECAGSPQEIVNDLMQEISGYQRVIH